MPAAKRASKKTTTKRSTLPKKATTSKRATLGVGKAAPNFRLESDDGGTVSLKDFAGKKLVVYFYPKDDTPGCTREACAFRDSFSSLAKQGVAVVGVSRDSIAAHTRFKAKYKLNFPLLSDPSTEMHKAYGAWGEKTMYGKAVTGVIRTTVLIDDAGKVAHVWPNVKVDGHVDAVREAIAQV